MKKYPLLIAGLLAVSLTACNNGQGSSSQNINFKSLSIVSPTGAPALGFYDFASVGSFETNTDPSNIVAMMNAGQKDVVVLPTNAGMNSIIKNAPYKIAATITFGNFYVASLHNDGNNVMDENDTILLFQKGNVPDKLFHYVYGDTFNANIHYVSAVNDVAVAVRDKKFVEEDRELVPNYVLTAEPSYTNLYSQYNSYFSEYANLQEEYKTKSNNKEIFQASVFIKNTVEANLANAFLNKLESDINAAISDSSKLSEGMNKVEAPATFFGIAPQMAVNVLNNNNRMGLGFKKAKANKAAIDQFLTLFNITETNEENYF